MEKEIDIKQYRIGEYATYMGVTPDFLKYYEQFHLVSSVVKGSGYRYYPFNQSYKILECMRLRNYGASIKDMDTILNTDDGASAKKKLDERIREIEKRMELEQAVVEEHRWFSGWLERMLGRREEWYVEETQEMYFLPHSNGYDFLGDERIYAVLKDWVTWMPMVKSCMEIRYEQGQQERKEYSWGLIVTKEFADRHGIPVNGVVKRLPARKAFLYHYSGLSHRQREERREDPDRRVFDRLHQMGLEPSGNIYKVLLMYTHVNEESEQYGYYMVPLQ